MDYATDIALLRRVRDKLVDEAASLQLQLADVQRRIRALDGTLAAFGEGTPSIAVPAIVPDRVRRRTRHRSKEAAVKDEVRRLLEGGARLTRHELTQHCVRAGILGTERSPLNRLATILSAARDEFESDRRGTYFLRRASPEPGSALAPLGAAGGDRTNAPLPETADTFTP